MSLSILSLKILILKFFRKLFYPVILKRARIDRRKPLKLSVTEELIFDNKKVVISLTTFPARVKFVVKTIYSLMNQDVKPNAIILWLSELQFPNKENDLPKELIELKNFGLLIKWLNDDIKSFKKLVPALKLYPNDIIVTADDDLYYPTYWLSSLLDSYKNYPNAIHTHCSTRIEYIDDTIRLQGRYGKCGDGSLSPMNKILGGSGTLYPPGLLYKDVANKELFMELSPTNDDIWFWAMALVNQVSIRWIPNNMRNLYYVENSQENSECLTNINDQGEKLIFIQAKNVIQKYNLYKNIIPIE